MKFELGDLVIVNTLVTSNSQNLYKKVGVIKHILKGQISDIGIEFNESIDGHNLNGYCPHPYGWYVQNKNIQKLEPLSKLLERQRAKEESIIQLGYIEPNPTILIEE
jgi:hypothetical protein